MGRVERDLVIVVSIFIFIIVLHNIIGCSSDHDTYSSSTQSTYVTEINEDNDTTSVVPVCTKHRGHGHCHCR